MFIREEILCEDLSKIELIKKDENSNQRGVETYYYKNENLDVKRTNHKNKIGKIKFKHKNTNRNSKKFVPNKPIDQNLVRVRENSHGSFNSNHIIPQTCDDSKIQVTFNESIPRSHIHVSELDSEEMVAKEIAKHLREPKIDLISNYFAFFNCFEFSLSKLYLKWDASKIWVKESH